jgi:hypothetical protein
MIFNLVAPQSVQCNLTSLSSFCAASLVEHALKLGLTEVKGRSDANNTILKEIYEGIGCKTESTGFGSSDDSACHYTEWTIPTADLFRSISHASALPHYRVRRVFIPFLSSAGIPSPEQITPLPRAANSAASLSHAACAAFVRGDVDGAKLLWQQLLQVPSGLQPSQESVGRAACVVHPPDAYFCSRSRRPLVLKELRRCSRLPFWAMRSEFFAAQYLFYCAVGNYVQPDAVHPQAGCRDSPRSHRCGSVDRASFWQLSC